MPGVFPALGFLEAAEDRPVHDAEGVALVDLVEQGFGLGQAGIDATEDAEQLLARGRQLASIAGVVEVGLHALAQLTDGGRDLGLDLFHVAQLAVHLDHLHAPANLLHGAHRLVQRLELGIGQALHVLAQGVERRIH